MLTDLTRIKSGKGEVVRQKLEQIHQEQLKNSFVESASFKLATCLAIFGVIIVATIIMVARIMDIKDIKTIQ